MNTRESFIIEITRDCSQFIAIRPIQKHEVHRTMKKGVLNP